MRKIVLFGFLLLLPSLLWATSTFKAGVDYQLVKATASATSTANKKTQVLEFFSYGCPWCNRLEPELEKWLATKPASVDFQRVPVTFNPSWENLAKAYYSAKALGVADKLTPLIFKAIHTDGMNLDTESALADFFSTHGVAKADFENAFNFSPGIDVQISRGNDLMSQYQILSVPTIIVNGKYKTDTAMNGGDVNKMMKVVSYLISLK